MPRRQRLLVPSKTSAPLRRLTFAPFSFCRLPTGTTTLELVVSGRSVAMGSLGCVHSSAATAAVVLQARAVMIAGSHTDLGYSIDFTCQLTWPRAIRKPRETPST